tara:strand:+ start:360 stop:533 length:174 start_codon:yes stop_codon:yes gene_type:complete
MKVKIFCKKSNWTITGTLIKESPTKIYIWSNERHSIELHFPKRTHFYKPIEDANNEE